MQGRIILIMVEVVIASLGMTLPLNAIDIWVSGIGDDTFGNGSVGSPYRTIKQAMQSAGGGDTIKVLTGDYNIAAGEVFPIDIKNNVDILGQEEDRQDWPRIGGDVNTGSSSIEALFRVPVTASSRTGIDVKNLWFVGDDHSGQDAPSAFLVRVSGGYSATVNFEDNHCERPAMKDGVAANDRPTVLVEGGWGTSNVTIVNCQDIEPSTRAAVEVRNGTDTTSTNKAIIAVTLRQNSIVLTSSGLPALYGFAFVASGEEWVEGRLNLRGNLIDSLIGAGHGGIDFGVSIELEPDGDGEIRVPEEHFEFTANRIVGHHGEAALRLRSVPMSANAVAELSLIDFERNEFRGQHLYGPIGFGILIERASIDSEYAGLVELRSHGNLIVENDVGVQVVDHVGGAGAIHLVNDTIAANDAMGLKLVGDEAWIDSLTNCIVYGNNSGGTQYDAGTTAWAPGTSTSWGFITEFCNFQGFTGGEQNLNTDPLFVSASTGDFHLLSSSPCIDEGDNVPDNGVELAEFDIDGEPRLDSSNPRLVDIGTDEYHP